MQKTAIFHDFFISHNQLPAFIAQEDKSLDFFFFVIVKERNPSNKELRQIAKKISNKWKPLGRELGFEEDELIGFEKDHQEYIEKAHAMLLAWKHGAGGKATYVVLHEALCEVGRRDLAEEFCQ